MSVTYLNKTYKNAASMIKDILVIEIELDPTHIDNFIHSIYRGFDLAPDTFVVLSRCDDTYGARYAIGSNRTVITKPMTPSEFVQSVHCFEFLKGVKCHG